MVIQNTFFQHGPYLINPDENAITVVWKTDRECVSSLSYGRDPKNLENLVFQSEYGLINALTDFHYVHLDGLEAGTKYYYQLHSTEIKYFGDRVVEYGDSVDSEVFSFNTLDTKKKDISFVVVNDIHEDIEMFKALLGRIDWKNVDLVFLNGDMLTNMDSEKMLMDLVIDPCVLFFARSIPLVYVRGNHETRGKAARAFFRYFPHPKKSFYYSFCHAGIYFLILDSGEDKQDDHIEYSGLVDFDVYRYKQTEWLKTHLNKAESYQSKFRFAFSHIPLFGGNNWHGERLIREKWAPLLNQHRFDIVFSGHTHKYAHIEPDGNQRNFHTLICGQGDMILADLNDDSAVFRIINHTGVDVDHFKLSVEQSNQI